MTRAPIVSRPEDDPEVPLDGNGNFARTFTLLTRSADTVRPLLGPAFQERLAAIWKPYIEIEGLGDRLVVTRRSWVEPAGVRQLLDQAAGILDELLRAARQ